MSRLREFINEEKEKIREIPGTKERVVYIWDYYKILIIALVCLVFFSVYVVYHYTTAIKDNWFYVTIANTAAGVDVDNGSELWEKFVEYGDFDIKEKNVMFNTNSYFTPGRGASNEYYTYFCAYVDGGTLDCIVMEKDDIEVLGQTGRLIDISNTELCGDLAEKYKDRLVYATPLDTEYSTEPVPIGIDLSDTCLLSKYHIYPETCVVGISSNTGHMDAVRTFLDFVFEESR